MLRVQAAKEKETESGQGISHINHQSVTPKDSWVRTMVLKQAQPSLGGNRRGRIGALPCCSDCFSNMHKSFWPLLG